MPATVQNTPSEQQGARAQCWAFHASTIPEATAVVVTVEGERWFRAGPRSWRPASPNLDGPCVDEAALLARGPVRCPEAERMLAKRDDCLAHQLIPGCDHMTVALDPWRHVQLPEHDETLTVDVAMMFMRLGWLGWTAKQRRDALTTWRESRAAVTS